MSPTQIDGSQINRGWKVLGGAVTAGLTLAIAVGVANSSPVYRVKNAAGIVTWQVDGSGNQSGSGAVLTSSGGKVQGFKGNGLTILNSVTYTFPAVDGSASGKTLKTNGAGVLSWSTDLSGGGGGVGTGNVVTIGDARYLKRQGDTATGGLLIVNGGHTGLPTIDAGLLLEVAGVASGRTLHAQDVLRSSGSLIVKGAATFEGLTSCTAIQTTTTGATKCNNALQPLNSTLTALAAYNTNGLLVQTAAGTFAGRTINGTSNRLSVSNGNGVSGNPTLDIDSAYVGQTTITSLGTLTTSPLAGTALNVAGIGSGRTMRAQDLLASSGTLIVSGATTLHNLSSCTLLQTSAAGLLSCLNNYAGQSTIVTLGTVTSGTWNGTTIAVANGGTAQTSAPVKSLALSAAGGTPSTTSGSSAKNVSFGTNGINLQTQDFTGSGTSKRYVQWTATMPNSYNGGTFTAQFNWFTSVTANTAKWYIQCQAYNDATTIDSAWGTAIGVSETAKGTANQMATTSATAAITCAGSPAAGSVVQFRVYRDPADAADTMAGTGRLVSALLKYTTTGYTD